ncbi:MAG: hypothetical protein ACXVGI_10400, partial [Mycobacteriaceae bacterium]
MSGSLDPVDWLDRVVGGGTERLVTARHHRRLAKLGQSGALRPTGTGLWAVEGSTEPRAGNALEVLIDGAEALLRMAEALSRAQSSVHIAGWHLEPDFALVRGEPPHTLLEILTELAERVDVRVLLWAGPPVPVFRPHRSSVQKIQKQLTTGTRIRCALDGRERT